MPDWYINKPEAREGDQFYLRAYFDLVTTRSQTESFVGPIPWDKIIMYAHYQELEHAMIDTFLLVIRAMEAADLKLIEEKRKAAEKVRKNKTRRSPARRGKR